MTYAVVGLAVLVLLAIWRALSLGRKVGRLTAEAKEHQKWRAAQGKAIDALTKAVEHEAKFKEFVERVHKSSSVDELDRLYAEITAPRTSPPSE